MPITEWADNEWQSGDADAFEVFFRQYERLVFKNAYLITGNKEEAEDVLQEVFISVWKARLTFDPGKGKLTTWLHKITINKCFERRRKKRLAPLPLDGTDLPEVALDDDVPVSRQEYRRLIEALSMLDNKHRAVLVLKYFDDLSCEEIAQAVGAPAGTVKSRINHALKLMRGMLDVKSSETIRYTGGSL